MQCASNASQFWKVREEGENLHGYDVENLQSAEMFQQIIVEPSADRDVKTFNGS